MVPESYATVADYRAGIDKLDDSSDAVIALDLVAMSRYLDRRLGRLFARDEQPQRRRYYFGWSCWLPTDDMSEEPSSVALNVAPGAPLPPDGGPQFGADFRLYPSNAVVDPLEPRPFEGLHFTAPRRNQSVDIVARWGWPVVPVGIQRATIQLTGLWRLETPRATQRINELDQVIGTSELAQRMIWDLMNTYRRCDFVVA